MLCICNSVIVSTYFITLFHVLVYKSHHFECKDLMSQFSVSSCMAIIKSKAHYMFVCKYTNDVTLIHTSKFAASAVLCNFCY